MAFIVFEGLDGSGKSTLIQALGKDLKKHGVDYLITEEPGGSLVGNQIRAVLLDKKNKSLCSKTELLLYQSIRAQHVDSVIKPAIQQGKWVICDRFTASSIAFQSSGRGIDLACVEYLNNFSTDNLKPELTVLLDIEPKESKARLNKRKNQVGQEKDRFEIEDLKFHIKVRNSYLKQSKSNPNWLILDGKNSTEINQNKIKNALLTKGWLKNLSGDCI